MRLSHTVTRRRFLGRVSLAGAAAGLSPYALPLGLRADDRPLTPPLSGFAGPGVARVGYGEHNQRSWLGLWSQHLAGSGEAAGEAEPGAERAVSVRAVHIAGRAKEANGR